jgi:hypothetical protein
MTKINRLIIENDLPWSAIGRVLTIITGEIRCGVDDNLFYVARSFSKKLSR